VQITSCCTRVFNLFICSAGSSFSEVSCYFRLRRNSEKQASLFRLSRLLLCITGKNLSKHTGRYLPGFSWGYSVYDREVSYRVSCFIFWSQSAPTSWGSFSNITEYLIQSIFYRKEVLYSITRQPLTSRLPSPPNRGRGKRRGGYFAISTTLFSRIKVTFICPGYCVSFSMRRATS